MKANDRAVGLPYESFCHCPRCGVSAAAIPSQPKFDCAACGFIYFFNPAVAAGVFLIDPDGRVLFLRRARDPARGKLAIPGGFIDYGETAEQGLGREIREEVGLEIQEFRFLCSQVNRYEYRDIAYPVVDLFFMASCPAGATPQTLDGVDALCWLRPDEAQADELAFPSIRAAVALLRKELPLG